LGVRWEIVLRSGWGVWVVRDDQPPWVVVLGGVRGRRAKVQKQLDRYTNVKTQNGSQISSRSRKYLMQAARSRRLKNCAINECRREAEGPLKKKKTLKRTGQGGEKHKMKGTGLVKDSMGH